ncbi:MAG: LPS-assembly protein LptD [Hyphomicrobiaceae bacterium]
MRASACPASLRLLALCLLAALVGFAGPAAAQDPSTRITTAQPPAAKSFPKKKGGIFGPTPKIDKAAPLYLQGDELVYDTKGNRVIARGNVEIYYNNYVLTADQVVYDQNANKLTAEGNAQLRDPNGTITRGDKLEATDDFRDAFIQSMSVVTRDDTRIAAERAVRREGNVTEFENGRFTPCKNDPGKPPLWCISAARVVHDQQAATITYQDAQFELFGMPILYLPYFQHADPSVKRRSGFLSPTFGNSTSLGFSTEVPYFFALAPNYDFTFHPRYFTKQGVLWQGDWRHRLANGQYEIKIAGIDQDADNLPAGTTNRLDGWRGSLETKGQFSLASWWRFGWDVTVESDDSFRRFYKLDDILQTDRVNTVYLQGMHDRNYFAANLYHFGGLLLNDTPLAESRVHPVIDYKYFLNNPVLGGELSFNAHARSMTRDDGTDTEHALVEVNWRRKIVDALGQVWKPFASLRGDAYSYQDAIDPDTHLRIPDDTVARGMATAGLTYSYPFVAHTANASHILEPTAQIIARPNRLDQRRLPDEDARSLVLDDTLLFDTDKFSGYDRMETGTRANLGLQYTWQSYSGPYLRAVAGQSIHLSGENAFANPGYDATGLVYNYSPLSGLETNKSDYVAGLYFSPIAGTSLVAQGRFDEKNMSLRRQDTYAQAYYGPVLGQLGYTFIKADATTPLLDDQQEVIGGLGFRLSDRWSILGQMRYDIDARDRIQDSLQLRYADECFVLSATYTETFVDNPALDIRQDRSLMVRFELKNLGEFNYKTDSINRMFGTNQTPKDLN